MKKHSPLIKRLLSILSVFAVLMAFSVMGFSAAAEDHIVIAIHNTGREVHDNPLIRIFLHKDMFGSGGPFTIKGEYKVENFGKQSAKNDPVVLCDIYTKESMGSEKTQDKRQLRPLRAPPRAIISRSITSTACPWVPICRSIISSTSVRAGQNATSMSVISG